MKSANASSITNARKVAVVTGAGSGIGQAAALQLAAEGIQVAVLDRSLSDLQQTLHLIRHGGGVVLPLVADVSKTKSMQRAFDRIRQKWGRLDIAFANAGVNGVWASLEHLKPEEWDSTLGINLRGTFLTVKFASMLMKATGGSIIITSSVQGNRVFSNSGASAYATSKAAQVAFGRMCALELAKDKIRVNTICPGAIQTHIGVRTKMKDKPQDLRLPIKFPKGTAPLAGLPGSPSQVGDLVMFLASDQARHITGTEIYIDGAESLLLG